MRMSGRLPENGAQPSEKFGTIARQFLHPLRQRDVQALPKIGDAALRFLSALFGSAQRFFQRGKLTAQRADLLVQHFDLRHRPCRQLLLGIQRLVEFGGAPRRIATRAGKSIVKTFDAIAFGFGREKAGAHLRQLVIEIEFAEFFQRQQVV